MKLTIDAKVAAPLRDLAEPVLLYQYEGHPIGRFLPASCSARPDPLDDFLPDLEIGDELRDALAPGFELCHVCLGDGSWIGDFVSQEFRLYQRRLAELGSEEAVAEQYAQGFSFAEVMARVQRFPW